MLFNYFIELLNKPRTLLRAMQAFLYNFFQNKLNKTHIAVYQLVKIKYTCIQKVFDEISKPKMPFFLTIIRQLTSLV